MKTSGYVINAILTVVLLGVGLVASLAYATPQNNKLIVARQTLQDLTQYNQYFVQFYSERILDLNKTEVSFPFALPDKNLTIWLGFTPENEDIRSDILVTHPALIYLDWTVLEGPNGVFLHQREPTFASFEEFVSTQTDPEQVLIDSFLKDNYPQFSESSEVDFAKDVSNSNYILTTYNHSPYDEGVYYFTRVVDASSAKVVNNKSIEWYLRTPEMVDESSYYLAGSFNINYIQY